MRPMIFALVFIRMLLAFPSFAVTPESRDSIMHHFLNKGAWKHSIHSKEYGRYIDSALALLPTEPYLWQQKGMPYFKEMRCEVGMPYVDSAVKYDSSMWVDYRAFLKCIFQKNYHAAIQDFWLAKHIRGESYVMDHPYDFYLGLCYLQLAQLDSADKYFRSVVETDSVLFGSNAIHYLHMLYYGIVLGERGDYEESVRWLDNAIASYPHFADAEYYKASALNSLGHHTEAAALLKISIADFAEGKTINEDNVAYERYPFQLNQHMLNMLEREVR